MKKLIYITLFTFLFCVSANAQTEEQKICISQESANECRANFLELKAIRAKVAVLEQALLDKDKNESDLKELARKNEADLKERLHATEIKLAETTGKLIKSEAEAVNLWARLDLFIAKPPKSKQNGAINFKVGGN